MEAFKQVFSVDIAKDSFEAHTGVITTTQQITHIASSRFSNSSSGFKRFLSWAKKHRRPDAEIWYVMEATGVYYEDLAFYLSNHKQNVAVLQPSRVKHYIQSTEVKNKTDRIDARMLCKMGLERPLQAWIPPSEQMRRLRALTRERQNLVEQAAELSVQREAVGHQHDPLAATLRRFEQHRTFLQNQIKEIEKEIHALVKDDSDLYERVNKIATIKGVGILTIVTVLAETNGFNQVERVKQLISYAGLDVVERSSGTYIGRRYLSKKGNARIRRILYMSALTASRSNTELNIYFRRIKENTRSGLSALMAVARKILRLIYALWRDDATYQTRPSLADTAKA